MKVTIDRKEIDHTLQLDLMMKRTISMNSIFMNRNIFIWILSMLLSSSFAFAQKQKSKDKKEKEVVFTPPVETKSSINNTGEKTEGIIPEQMLFVDGPAPTIEPALDRGPEVFSYVEEMPEFHDGQEALMKYISSNIKYPESAKKTGIQGKCFVKFIVGKDGKIRDVNVTKGVLDCKQCDEEAKRVISNMPLWKPGKNVGKEVDVYYLLPVKFTLPENKEK